MEYCNHFRVQFLKCSNLNIEVRDTEVHLGVVESLTKLNSHTFSNKGNSKNGCNMFDILLNINFCGGIFMGIHK